MASPRAEVLFFYDSVAGTPKTGLTLTFSTYKDTSGTNLSQPTFTEIGGGAYMFTPTFADPTKGIVYVVNGGATAVPQYQARYMRPEDWNTDNSDWSVANLKEWAQGSWQIQTTGPDANKLIIYGTDGVTVLHKFALTDQNGNPTSTNVFKRSV